MTRRHKVLVAAFGVFWVGVAIGYAVHSEWLGIFYWVLLLAFLLGTRWWDRRRA